MLNAGERMIHDTRVVRNDGTGAVDLEDGQGGRLNVVTATTDAVTGYIQGLSSPNGIVDSVGSAVVAAATGVSATDTAEINAAIVRAGTGGVVVFPPNQTTAYSCKGYPGSTSIIPRKIIGNGATLKLAASVSTTTTANYVQGTDTEITVTDSTIFAVGDQVCISDGTGKFTYSGTVLSKADSTHVTTTATLTAAGTAGTISSGAIVLRDDYCLRFTMAAADTPVEIDGLIFDGNAANRLVARQWTNQNLLQLNGLYGTAFKSAAWVHHCVFQNSPCDAISMNDLMYAKVTDNHFHDINGMGVHPGGSGLMKDYICANNTFYQVQMLTAASTPTATNYGHIGGSGVMCTSTGPGRCVIQGNIVDTSNSWGFDGILASTHTDTVVADNVFYACGKGAWRQTSGGPAVFANNVVTNCGHETPVIAGAQEITSNAGSSASRTTISGNIFNNSCLAVHQDASEMTVSGNTFNFVTKALGSVELGALIMTRSSGGDANVNIVGNNFRGPRTTAESTAVSNAVMPCIRAGTLTGVNFSGNVFVGGLYGIDIQPASSSISRGVSINSNTFVDQMSTTSAAAIRWTGSTHSAYSCAINGNTMSLTVADPQIWNGINITASALAGKAFTIANNTIQTEANPAGGQSGIILTGATSGVFVTGNNVSLNNAGSGSAISAGSATATCVITDNIANNSNTISAGSALTTTGNHLL